MKKALNQAKILNIPVNSTTRQEVLDTIGNRIKNKDKFVVFTPNPEMILAAQEDPELALILNRADLLIPDGVGLKLGAPNLTIYKGRQLMVDLFSLSNKLKLKVFLLGSIDSVVSDSLIKLKSDYPNLTAKGNSGPLLDKKGLPVSEKDLKLEQEVIKEINEFKPNFLFVAFGTPKEQKWIAKHKDELKVNCIMEVGGALDYFSGKAKLPPAIINSMNLEWLWRLIRQPQRFKRIYRAVFVFPLKILLSKFILQAQKGA